MIYLDDYKQYRIKYLFDEDNQFVVDESFKGKNTIDLSPGRVQIIDVNVVDVSHILVITPKLAIDDIRCDGVGCLSISEVQNGIFKVLIKPDLQVDISVRNNICWSGLLERNTNTVALCEDK